MTLYKAASVTVIRTLVPYVGSPTSRFLCECTCGTLMNLSSKGVHDNPCRCQKRAKLESKRLKYSAAHAAVVENHAV